MRTFFLKYNIIKINYRPILGRVVNFTGIVSKLVIKVKESF
jgi:hypothetical protein